MSEVKHTPGPWKVLCVPTLHEWETKKYFVAAVPYEGHPYYQRTRYFDIAGDEEYPTKAADLRLIAAAPALLEALETMLKGDELGEFECQRQSFPRWIERQEKARAALALAKEGK